MANHHHTPGSPNLPKGSALEHGEAHTHAHTSRRDFLRTLGFVGAGSLLLGKLPVNALSNSPLAYWLSRAESDRILVIIRLKGGNDGMNMVVPVFDYGTYLRNRPTLAIPQSQLLGIGSEFALPQVMQPLHRRWQQGAMQVVHSVGYANQNLSHFRSSDIWASGNTEDAVLNSGWLGRWIDSAYPNLVLDPPAAPPAIQIGGAGNLLFNNEDMLNLGMVVGRPEELARIASQGQLYDAEDVPDCYYGEQLQFVRRLANNTFTYAGAISNAYDRATNSREYSGSLGDQLAIVARLIKGGLNTRLYMVTLDGFDTHAKQPEYHPALLQNLAAAVDAFFADLSAGGHDQRVLTMSISEFGRRIEENASQGTDHGAAAPLLLCGPALESNAFAGTAPNLQQLDEIGNLPASTDFRSVYATVLEQWLCVPAPAVNDILGADYPRMATLGLTCNATGTRNPGGGNNIKRRIVRTDDEWVLTLELSRAGQVRIQLLNILGQSQQVLFTGSLPGGEQQLRLHPTGHLARGPYIIIIEAGAEIASEKVIW